MKFRLFTLVLFSALLSNAQTQPSKWFFGAQGYLDFSSGVGVALPSPSTMPSSLGATVQCDVNGQVFFYSNGETVYDANNTVMPNGTGLFGVFIGIWNTQEIIAIPDPGNPNEYYLFTIPSNGSDLSYSKIDMTLNGGLGDVTLKNVLLQVGVNSQMTAVKHANCIDYWLMTHQAGTSNYLAFEITAGGIQPPVINTIGIPIIASGVSVGAMKFSPDGARLVSLRANYFTSVSAAQKNRFDLLDFDNATGLLSNALSSPVGLFPPTAGNDYFMGVDFSADGRVFYISKRGETNGGVPQILQFDATIPTPWTSAINVSNYSSFPNVPGRPFGLQLGPDGKIYISEVGTGFLGIIDNPGQLGLGCGFLTAAVPLPGGIASVGLPSFVQSDLLDDFVNFNTSGNCASTPIDFNYLGANGVDSVLWDFGDGTTTTIVAPNTLSTSHTYTSSGTYNIELVGWRNCLTDTFNLDVIIDSLPSINMTDTTLCDGDTLVSDFSNLQNVSLEWNDGSTDSIYVVTAGGNYGVTATTLNGCVVSDSAQITFLAIPNPSILLVNDTLCFGVAPLALNATPAGGTWSGAGVDPTGLFDPSSGTGEFELFYSTGGQCSVTDSAIIYVETLPIVSFSADTLQGCEPLEVNFNNESFIQGQSVLWDFGDGQTDDFLEQGQHTFLSAGNYDVAMTVTSESGCSNTATEINYIAVFPNPIARFTYEEALTDTGTVVQFIDASLNAASWNWTLDNSATSTAQNPTNFYATGGQYLVELAVVSSEGCTDKIEGFIDVSEPFYVYVPNAFTPDGDERNNLFYPVIEGGNLSEFEFSIYNRWGIRVFASNELNEGWSGVELKTGQNAPVGTYTWKLVVREKKNANAYIKYGHVSLIR